jgi:hypothetical protein
MSAPEDGRPALGSHRAGRRAGREIVVDGHVVRRVQLVVACANAAVAAAFIVAPAGSAPSIVLMQAVAPLWAWGVGYALVAVLLTVDRLLAAHLLAVPLWLFWGASAVLGLATGATLSPAVTIALTGLILLMAGLHANGLIWRRREARARRAT